MSFFFVLQCQLSHFWRPFLIQVAKNYMTQLIIQDLKDIQDKNSVAYFWLTNPFLITCSWHVFTNSESTNEQFFSQRMSCFLLNELQSVLFYEINSFSNIFDLNWKILPWLIEKTSWICRFGIRENMSRTCYLRSN